MSDFITQLTSQGYYVFECVNATVPNQSIRGLDAGQIKMHKRCAVEHQAGPYDLIYPGPSYETAHCALAFLSGYQHENRPESAMPVETTECGVPQHIFDPSFIPSMLSEGSSKLQAQNEELYMGSSKYYGPGAIAELKQALSPQELGFFGDEAIDHLTWILRTNTIRPGSDGGSILVFTYWWIPILAAWRIKSQNGEKLERHYMSHEKLNGIRILAKQTFGEHQYEFTVHGTVKYWPPPME